MMNKDLTNWVPFIAIVEDINDPLKLGRVRLRVLNHHDDDIDTEHLDWSTPLVPNAQQTQGIGVSPTGYGLKTTVVGFYLDGNMRQMPMIIGAIATIPENDIAQHGVNKLARGEDTITNNSLGPEPKREYGAQYPSNKVIATPGGHIIEIDDTKGAERINVRHTSGSYITINSSGSIVIKSVDNYYQIAGKDSISYSEGDQKIETKGKLTFKVNSDCAFDVKGDTNIHSSGKVAITASKVTLN